MMDTTALWALAAAAVDEFVIQLDAVVGRGSLWSRQRSHWNCLVMSLLITALASSSLLGNDHQHGPSRAHLLWYGRDGTGSWVMTRESAELVIGQFLVHNIFNSLELINALLLLLRWESPSRNYGCYDYTCHFSLGHTVLGRAVVGYYRVIIVQRRVGSCCESDFIRARCLWIDGTLARYCEGTLQLVQSEDWAQKLIRWKFVASSAVASSSSSALLLLLPNRYGWWSGRGMKMV